MKSMERGAGPVSGSNRLLRGGNWDNNAENVRCSNRNNNGLANENNNIGIRLVSTPLRSRTELSHPRLPCPV